MLNLSIHAFTRRWQHSQGCALQPDASNTLGGYAYMLTLAFTPLVPDIGNTLAGLRLTRR
jgi:hypothetical protein